MAVGSERAFGLVFAAVFAIIALWPLWEGLSPRWWALGATTAFLVLALVLPRALKPLNLLWFKFGLLLHKVVTPLVMGVLFYLTVTPIGLLMRVLGKRPLPLAFDAGAETYWIRRDPPGPAPETMIRQF